MDEIVIKQEYMSDDLPQCRTCLSVGRKLSELGDLKEVLTKISCLDLNNSFTENLNIQLCWECTALLKRIKEFQQQIEKADMLLKSRQNTIINSLSKLTIITSNEIKNIIYVNDVFTNGPFHTNSAILKTHSHKNKTCINFNDGNIDLIDNCEDIDKELEHTLTEEKCSNFENVTSKMFNEKRCSNSKNTKSKILNEESEMNLKMVKNKVSKTDSKDFCNIFDGTKTKLIDGSYEIPKSVKLNKYTKSRWAIQKAEENKKNKLKILTPNFNNLFVKIKNNEGLHQRGTTTERDSNTCFKDKLKCSLCKERLESIFECIEHTKMKHSSDTIYICDICNTFYLSKSRLIKHIKRHSYVYKCLVCLSVCRDVVEHMKLHAKIFECVNCGLKFGNRREFFKHYKGWHEKYICDYCGISFKLKYCIEDHIKKKHSPHECKPCNKSFSRYSGLWLHNKLEHTRPALPAYCVECDKHYDSVYKYKWHLYNSSIHTPKKKRSISCPDCSKVFTKNIYMKDHYNFVHLKIFKYRCEKCNKNFIRNAELVKHNRRIHEGIIPARNKMCYVCGRGFTTNKILSTHLRTHSGEKIK